MINPRLLLIAAVALTAVAIPASVSAAKTMPVVDSRLAQANDSIDNANSAIADLDLERAIAAANRADKRTDAAARAARKLSGSDRKKAMRRVRRQREVNAFTAEKIANSAESLPPADRGDIVNSLGILVENLIFGGPPGSLFGPGGTPNFPGLLGKLGIEP